MPMSTDGIPELEPPPFDPDEPPRPRRARPWEPMDPMTQDELDHILARPAELRTLNPWLCAYNLNAEDGIGYMSGMGWRQCPVHVADPTKSRYCLEHARELGVDFYSPTETSEATDREVAGSLTRIVPKAVRTLELVMDDDDAPPGIRAKAADSVLDRTGYSKGVDVRVDAKVATVDITSIIHDRLNALREAQLKDFSAATPGTGDAASVTDETAKSATGGPEMPVLSAIPGTILSVSTNTESNSDGDGERDGGPEQGERAPGDPR